MQQRDLVQAQIERLHAHMEQQSSAAPAAAAAASAPSPVTTPLNGTDAASSSDGGNAQALAKAAAQQAAAAPDPTTSADAVPQQSSVEVRHSNLLRGVTGILGVFRGFPCSVVSVALQRILQLPGHTHDQASLGAQVKA